MNSHLAGYARYWLVVLTIASSCACCLVRPASAQVGGVVLRGRVIDSTGKPIRDVDMIVSGVGSDNKVTVRTDSRGTFTVVFREPSDGYTVEARKVGFTPFAQRLIHEPSSALVAVPDISLVASPVRLSTLIARQRPQIVPSAGVGAPPLSGGQLDAGEAQRFLSTPGDINAIASQLAGVNSRGDSGYSVLGARSDQNRVMIDGSDFGESSLPRDALGTAVLITHSADPSNGQFAGGEMSISTRYGAEQFGARLRGEVVDRHLTWNDPTAPTVAPQSVTVSGFATFPSGQKFRSFLAWDASRRTVSEPNLTAPRDAALAQLGVIPDSVQNALSSLRRLGVSTGDGLSSSIVRDQVAATLRLDYRLGPITSLTLEALGNWSRSTGAGIGDLSLPTVASNSRSSSVQFAFSGSTFAHQILETFHVALRPSSSHRDALVGVPAGSVLVGTLVDSSLPGLASFRFGGSNIGSSARNGSTVQANNELIWTAPDLRHMVRFTQEFRHDGAMYQFEPGSGAFSFQSLADLASNHPSEFARTIGAADYAASATTVAWSIGDLWRVSRGKLEIQGGIRYDRRVEGVSPKFNPLVDSLFGRRTDQLPIDQGWSPRLGFSWHPGRADKRMPIGFATRGPRGGLSTRGYLTPNWADGIEIPDDGEPLVVRGNIGAYRSLIGPERGGSLANNTGLPGTTAFLQCVGDAVPTPDWRSPSVPLSCSNNTAETVMPQQRVAIFDPAFRSPVSWRGELELGGLRLAGWGVFPEFDYAYGDHAESDVNINLSRTPAFALASEANRPVYSPASAITPTSGFFVQGASLKSQILGDVTEIRSDLHYTDLRVLIAIVPPYVRGKPAPITVTYAYSRDRQVNRGFGGTTAGDPFAIESSAGQTPTHQLFFTTKDVHAWWLAGAFRLQLVSGVPFTPVVASDINGDGLANDRAFIFYPPAVTVPALRDQLAELYASAPARARDCLLAQMGRIAAANSCRTDWRAQLDFKLDFSPPASFALGDRMRVTTRFLNAGGALVRLFGLENTPLGESAASSVVDSRLLYVTGFDPAGGSFTYRVNQLFGQPIDFGTAKHRFPSFQVQLGAEYRFGYPKVNKSARALPLLRNPADTASIRVQVYHEALRITGGNPLDTVLALHDTLQLTGAQQDALREISKEFSAAIESASAPVVAYSIRHARVLSEDDLFAQLLPMLAAWRRLRQETFIRALSFLLEAQRDELFRLGIRN